MVEVLAVEVRDRQSLGNLKSRSPNCLDLLHERHCCQFEWSTMVLSLQAGFPQICIHCRHHHQIEMGTHMACSDLILPPLHKWCQAEEVEGVVVAEEV